MFKYMFAGFLSAISLTASAQELTSFNAMTASLSEGKLITIVYDNTKCVINNPNSFLLPDGTAIFQPHAVIMNNEKGIAARGDWFTTGIPQHTNGINQQYSMLIDKNNQMTVRYQFFNSSNGKSNDIKDITLSCALGKGFRVFN